MKLILDLVMIAGFLAFGYGLWLAWTPLPFICLGLSTAVACMKLADARKAAAVKQHDQQGQ